MKAEIFFGVVVETQDEQHKYRIRATIKGMTEKIPVDELPWFYPFFGIHNLPVKDDEIMIFIFEDNLTMGFYGPKINLSDNGYTDTEYENYLEIYNRLGVELKYSESLGIEFINDVSKVQIETDKISQIVDDNHITIEANRIEIGVESLEPTPLGDKTVDAFDKTIETDDSGFQLCMDIFNAIASAATTPPTAPIKAAILAMLPGAKAKQASSKADTLAFSKTIRSKLVFIE